MGIKNLIRTRKRQRDLKKAMKGKIYTTKIDSWGIHPTYMYNVDVYKNNKEVKGKSQTFNTIIDAKRYGLKVRRLMKGKGGKK